MKKAFITGITGQDGSYLTEYLLKKGYLVYGLQRRSSTDNTLNLRSLHNEILARKKLFLFYGDLTDSTNLNNLIKDIMPDEVYNLAAQSHVHTSFHVPEYTADVNANGTLRLLEAIRVVSKDIKFYQASTSELYGNTSSGKLNEDDVFDPQSPYAISKLYSFWMVKNYREAYDMFCVNGILFKS